MPPSLTLRSALLCVATLIAIGISSFSLSCPNTRTHSPSFAAPCCVHCLSTYEVSALNSLIDGCSPPWNALLGNYNKSSPKCEDLNQNWVTCSQEGNIVALCNLIWYKLLIIPFRNMSNNKMICLDSHIEIFPSLNSMCDFLSFFSIFFLPRDMSNCSVSNFNWVQPNFAVKYLFSIFFLFFTISQKSCTQHTQRWFLDVALSSLFGLIELFVSSISQPLQLLHYRDVSYNLFTKFPKSSATKMCFSFLFKSHLHNPTATWATTVWHPFHNLTQKLLI